MMALSSAERTAARHSQLIILDSILENYHSSVIDSSNELLTKPEVASFLRVNLRTISRYVVQGKLPSYRVAGSRPCRFRKSDVERLLMPISAGQERDLSLDAFIKQQQGGLIQWICPKEVSWRGTRLCHLAFRKRHMVTQH